MCCAASAAGLTLSLARVGAGTLLPGWLPVFSVVVVVVGVASYLAAVVLSVLPRVTGHLRWRVRGRMPVD